MEAAQSAANADGANVAHSELAQDENNSASSTTVSAKGKKMANEKVCSGSAAAAAALAMVASGGQTAASSSIAAAAPTSAGEAALARAKGGGGGASAAPAMAAPAPVGATPTSVAMNNSSVGSAKAVRSPVPGRPSSLHPTTSNTASHAPVPANAPAPVRGGATGSSGGSGGGGKKKGPPLRRGKWTPEEEAYANRLIQEFKAGLLPLTDGTTLRTFLSKLLNCDPMRISKKFVGSNCIGKQVFRRRTADINRLTPEQIQQSRSELSELERRFLERVAQTNRVKSSGVGSASGGGGGGGAASSSGAISADKAKFDETNAHHGGSSPPSPPWLRPPAGFKPGGSANRAAAAGRAMLLGNNSGKTKSSNDSANILAAALHQRQSQQDLLHAAMAGSLSASRSSGSNLLAAASGAAALSGPTLAQLAKTASAAKLGANAGNSIDNLMLKTGLSRDQLSQLARDQSLSNFMERQSSFDALMSLDFQSLQSIDNLANLIQSGGGGQTQVIPKSGMKNWDGGSSANPATAAVGTANAGGSGGNLPNLASSQRVLSESRMESLIRSLSSGNVDQKTTNIGSSNANFSSLLQSLQSSNSLGAVGGSANNLFGSGNPSASAINLANMLRTDSSTGLTALRMQDGLAQRNTSVDDFLSLVASGDIPHQDPHLLNVPLQNVMQQQAAAGNQSGAQQAAATYLAQQQLLAQAANGGSNSISNSLGNLAGNVSVQNLLSQLAASQGASAGNLAAVALLGNEGSNKRKLDDSIGTDGQGRKKH
mmetsp:Transcript_23320/g.50708  ORF Transcript_23320/g.50708 Transcript_23320/m.50708 type:complete len:769 (-) Transcript_23320:3485-5791(-)